MVYLQDNDTKKSYWLSYDNILDNWNENYFKKALSNQDTILLDSKYKTAFNKIAEAQNVNLPEPEISIELDTIINNERIIIKIHIIIPLAFLLRNKLEELSESDGKFAVLSY